MWPDCWPRTKDGIGFDHKAEDCLCDQDMNHTISHICQWIYSLGTSELTSLHREFLHPWCFIRLPCQACNKKRCNRDSAYQWSPVSRHFEWPFWPRLREKGWNWECYFDIVYGGSWSANLCLHNTTYFIVIVVGESNWHLFDLNAWRPLRLIRAEGCGWLSHRPAVPEGILGRRADCNVAVID